MELINKLKVESIITISATIIVVVISIFFCYSIINGSKESKEQLSQEYHIVHYSNGIIIGEFDTIGVPREYQHNNRISFTTKDNKEITLSGTYSNTRTK